MCQGFEDFKQCEDCHRRTAKVGFQQSYFYPPMDIATGKCNFYWPSTDWNDPKRDMAIAQNGNVGYIEGDM